MDHAIPHFPDELALGYIRGIDKATGRQVREQLTGCAFLAPQDLARLLLLQGMRPKEVSGLAKRDVNVERGQLQVVEGQTAAACRTLDLMTESRRILAARMAGDSAWLFPSKRNPGRHIMRLNSAHDRLCQQAREQTGSSSTLCSTISGIRGQRGGQRRCRVALTWRV